MQYTTRTSSRTAIVVALLAVAGLGACSSASQFFPTSPAALENQVTRDDGRLAAQALMAMLNDGATSARNWSNTSTGHWGVITPVRSFTSEAGLRCVEYRDTFTINNDTATAINTACMGPDRAWQNMDANGRWQKIG